jgi:hypothetical protein
MKRLHHIEFLDILNCLLCFLTINVGRAMYIYNQSCYNQLQRDNIYKLKFKHLYLNLDNIVFESIQLASFSFI